ncbi:hypothetical protein [Patiriisocius hiemis]|uniref:Uncharacterized protein n=1 Tax=Patiriisocius hiemis TaxID=3075604 RepID=A0ABU2YA01_9FLAO|nr:hypothetical protein [Constantimarinum sp. W242]MDT0554610.1 hypothetical protein [Constantimarinum sp. W242]
MELEEMKSLWSSLSDKVAKQELVNKKLVMEMTQQKYKNKFKTLLNYEIVGSVICFLTAVLILFNLDKMDTWYLMTCAVFSLAFILVLPVLVLKNLIGIKNITIVNSTYKQTITHFAKEKKRLMLIQQIGLSFSVVLMFTTMPVFSMIFNNKDFFKQEYGVGFWIFIGVLAIGVLLFSLWGYRCYKRIMSSAEDLLKGIE